MIDSSNWVVGGSDSSVAVETNSARRPANQERRRASGIHLTHAKDFLRTRTHTNTPETRACLTSPEFAGYLGVCVCQRLFVRVCVCACTCARRRAALMCVFAPHVVGVFCPRCLRVVDVVVMGECSLPHTHSPEQGSACIKRANKLSFPHPQPRQDEQAGTSLWPEEAGWRLGGDRWRSVEAGGGCWRLLEGGVESGELGITW